MTAPSTAPPPPVLRRAHPLADAGTRRVLVAMDKFRGSLTAPEACAAAAAGLLDARPELEVVTVPLSDGGEGFLDALGPSRRVGVGVRGPLGTQVQAEVALLEDAGPDGAGAVAAIESSQAVGHRLLPGRPDPWTAATASTYGVGELIVRALDLGARTIVIGCGGTVTTDGGVGAAQALGARFADTQGRALDAGGAALGAVARADLSGVDPRLAGVRLICAVDVRATLLGPDGPAMAFSGQKGADALTRSRLGRGLALLVGCVGPLRGEGLHRRAGTGAGGGLPYGLLAAAPHAELVPGAELVLDSRDVTRDLSDFDVVVTGEGKLDRQSLDGKAPVALAGRARDAGRRAVALCGAVTLGDPAAAALARAHALAEVEPDPGRALRHAAAALQALAARCASDQVR